MKKVEKFKCEVCGREYNTEEDCRKCEAACNSPYLYYTLELTPYENKFVFKKEPLSSKPYRLATVYRDVVDNDPYETVVWSIGVTKSLHTEEEVHNKLIEAARLWLTGLIKELDRLTYFQL